MHAAKPLPSRRSVLLSALGSFAALTLSVSSCAAAGHQQPPPPLPLFTDSERDTIRAYWSVPGRYTITPSPDTKDRVNVTAEGSLWYWTLLHTKPTDAATGTLWKDWLTRRAAYEKACCGNAPAKPDDPGPAPAPLVAAIGANCPKLYEHVTPMRYTVTFAPGDAEAPIVYEDGVDFGKRAAYYAYYRNRTGVMRNGKHFKEYEGDDKKRIDALFGKAGRSDSERRVLQAVSYYEGGFEAINTYDTGFISVGFLQFTTGVDGTGSLSQVLARYKTDDAQGFYANFHRFGLDVSLDGVLVCVDPATGRELRGNDAVHCVIDDKRLTAIFERAAISDGFRLAQISVARDRYWPGDDPVVAVVVPPKNPIDVPAIEASPAIAAAPDPAVSSAASTVCVSDVVHSEAGLATLMDRKVNKGHLRDLPDVAARLMKEKGLTDPHDLSRYERSLIVAMKYRGDFLADPTLSQPPPEPADDTPRKDDGTAPASPQPAPSHKRRR